MLGYFVATAMAAVILVIIWYRGRRRDAVGAVRAHPNRGLTGEAVTAFENVAHQMLDAQRDSIAAPRDAVTRTAAKRPGT